MGQRAASAGLRVKCQAEKHCFLLFLQRQDPEALIQGQVMEMFQCFTHQGTACVYIRYLKEETRSAGWKQEGPVN